MNTATTMHRKLIDIRRDVFISLSLEAEKKGISLKKYIENLLEEACPRREEKISTGIGRLIGSARPDKGKLSEIKDDRLQYLLSK